MKTTSALLITLAIFTSGICRGGTWEPTGPNLLADGGFEQGLTTWYVTGNKDAAVVEEKVRHSGKRSLRLSATGRPGETRVIAGAKVDPAKKYCVSFTAKAEGIGRNPKLTNADFSLDMAVAVGLAAYDGNRWLDWCPTSEAVGVSGTSDWKTYTFDVTKLPPATKSVQLHLIYHNGAVGTVWFDDVEIKELSLRRPSLTLSCDPPANVFSVSEKAQAEARLGNDATPHDFTLRWDVRESRGKRAAQGERHVALAAGEERVETIPLGQAVGHYVVTAQVLDHGTARDHDRLEAAIVPDPPRQPCPSLALWPGDYALARKAGASWTRDVAYWRYLEPEPGKWNWKPLETNLKGAKAAGLNVVLCFSEISAWASSAPPGSADFFIYPPKRWDELARFVEAVVAHLGADVAAWEIWNEPVMPWGWKGSVEDIVTLHRVIHDAIRRVQPTALILGPCINQGGVPTLKLATFQAVLPLGILKYCDGLVIHPYREPQGPEATFFFEELGRLRQFNAEQHIGQGIWITEIGWSSAEFPWGSPKVRISEVDQAAYVVRSMVAAVAAQVRLYNWHELCEYDIPDPYQRSYGLVRARLAGPKPGYVAYALAAHYLAQARFVRRLTGMGPLCPRERFSHDKTWNDLRPASIRAVDGYWFDRPEGSLLIAWSISGRNEVIELPASGEVRLEDALGSTSRLSPQAGRIRLTLSELPLYVLWPATHR